MSVQIVSPPPPAAQALKETLNGKAKAEEKTQTSGQAGSVPVTQKPVKEVIFTKGEGEKWSMTVKGKVSRREINRLRITMIMYWNRMKRSERLGRSRLEKIKVEAERLEKESLSGR